MYEIDTQEALSNAVRQFPDDLRLTHFYDPHKIVGESIALSLGGQASDIAWDVYLLYDHQSEWLAEPPEPVVWIHQLAGSRWADPDRYHTGNDLVSSLYRMLEPYLSA